MHELSRQLKCFLFAVFYLLCVIIVALPCNSSRRLIDFGINYNAKNSNIMISISWILLIWYCSKCVEWHLISGPLYCLLFMIFPFYREVAEAGVPTWQRASLPHDVHSLLDCLWSQPALLSHVMLRTETTCAGCLLGEVCIQTVEPLVPEFVRGCRLQSLALYLNCIFIYIVLQICLCTQVINTWPFEASSLLHSLSPNSS